MLAKDIREAMIEAEIKLMLFFMRESCFIIGIKIYVMKKRPHRSPMCSFDDPVAVSRERRSVLRRCRYDSLRCSEEEK